MVCVICLMSQFRTLFDAQEDFTVNEALNRFGFTEGMMHGRVPGPYVPLQDEPNDAGGIRAERNKNTVLVPQIQSMKEYILKHHKRLIFETLNRSIRTGAIDLPADADNGKVLLSASNCTIGEMNFWRYDKYTALADVIVKPEIFTSEDIVSCPLYVELWIDMKTGMEFYAGECGLLSLLPERPYRRLDSYLIPILRKDEIESGSEELLLKYCPKALEDVSEHSPFVLAQRMGLKVERLPLYKKARTLSMLFFCPGTVTVQQEPAEQDDEPPKPYEVTIPGDTILINTRAVHKDYCQLEIFHECVHYDWHFMFYRLQHMHNNDINALRTKRIVITDSTKNRNPLRWMEWQANRGSFGLMTPLSMMRPLVNEQKNSLTGSPLHWGKRYDLIARRIAREYDLPKFRVRARLIQMNLIAARGALNYVDGSYIEPFAFDLSRGNGNYSFVLTRENLFEEYENNAAFRERMDSGDYVYVDGHVCLNDERYVRNTTLGLRLTPWANAHVDQCCLRFISVYEACGLSDYCFGCLNSDEEYNRHYISFAEDGNELSAKERLEHMDRVLKALPDSFPKAMDYLMRSSKVTAERLVEKTGLSESTITRLRTRESDNYKLDQVIVLCVALHLPPWLSSEMLSKAGVMLRHTKQHRAYRLILDCMFMDSVETVQDFLTASGCTPLKPKAT